MSIKKILKSVFIALLIAGASVASVAFAAFTISQGGTATSTAPTTDQILSGQLNGTYKYTNANAADGWLKLDGNGNFSGKIIQFLAASTSLSSIVLDKGLIGVASDTPGQVFIGDGLKAGGYPVGFWQQGTTTAASTSIIYNGGKIGVGITIPTAKLDLRSRIANEAIVNLQNTVNGGQFQIDANGSTFMTGAIDVEGGAIFNGINSNTSTFQIIDGPNGTPDLKITGDTDTGDLYEIYGNDENGFANLQLTSNNIAFFNNAKLGVGTSSPAATFAVVGNILASSTATSTFKGGGINLVTTTGCFAVNGTCLSTSGGSGTPAGSNTQIQFNNSGSFGATTSLTYSLGSNLLSLNGDLSVGGGCQTIETSKVPYGVNIGDVNGCGTGNSIQTDTGSGAMFLTAADGVFLSGDPTVSLTASSISLNGTTTLSNIQGKVLATDLSGHIIGTTTTGGGGSGTVNSGTTGQVAYYASTGTAVSGTSTLFITGNKVGIGTTTAPYQLSVQALGSSSLVPTLFLASTTINSLGGGAVAIGFAQDQSASGIDSTYLYNPYAGTGFTRVTRLYLGSAANDWYSLNLSNVSAGIEGLSTIAITGNYAGGQCYGFTDCSIGMTRDVNKLRFTDNYPGDTTDAFTFNVNGEVARITNNGSLGIGTTSPIATLTVEGTSTASNANLAVFASSSTSILDVINNKGWLGIGTTNPTSNITIQGTTGDLFKILNGLVTIFRVNSLNGDTLVGGALSTGQGLTVGSGGVQVIDGPSSDNVFAITGDTDNSDLDITIGDGTDGYATEDLNSAGNIVFNTSATTNNFVFLNGKVGIGTTSPISALAVVGTTTITQGLTVKGLAPSIFSGPISANGITASNVTGSTQCIHVNSSGVLSGTGADCAAGSTSIGSGTTGQIPYYASSGTTLTATSSIFIATTTNVAIGTTTAPYKLTVNGTLGAKDIYSNNFLFGNATGTNGTSIVLGSVHDAGSILGVNNFVVGENAGKFSNSGSNNVFIGSAAGENTTGVENVFLGDSAGGVNGTGGYNVFLGSAAGQNNDSGSENVFLGQFAGSGNINGNGNVFLGLIAGGGNTSGSQNVAIGQTAGAAINTGINNAYIGYNAGVSATGSGNSFFGNYSGAGQSGGDYNIAIGNGADLANLSGNQQLNIGNLIYGTGVYNGGASHSSTPTGGLVGIGSSTPTSFLSVQGFSGSVSPLFTVASSSSSIQFQVDSKGHQIYGGTTPTINSCGSGASVLAGNDNVARIKVGSTLAQTSCVINFANTWVNPPICDSNIEGGLTIFTSASSTVSTLTITGVSTFTGDVLTFQCHGY